jgi:hypothetical protein
MRVPTLSGWTVPFAAIAKVGIGEYVEVKMAEWKPAKKVVLAPALKKASVSWATALASKVLPVPGGPKRSTPFGGSMFAARVPVRSTEAI